MERRIVSTRDQISRRDREFTRAAHQLLWPIHASFAVQQLCSRERLEENSNSTDYRPLATRVQCSSCVAVKAGSYSTLPLNPITASFDEPRLLPGRHVPPTCALLSPRVG